MDTEISITTYFSSLILLIISVMLYSISKVICRKSKACLRHWRYLSIIFLYLSIDESASIHEKLIIPLRRAFDLTGVLYFSWVIVGFIVIIIMALFYAKFLYELPLKTRITFICAAGAYIGGALGFELIGGYYASNFSGSNFVYGVITTIEETLELTGLLIFMSALFTKNMDETKRQTHWEMLNQKVKLDIPIILTGGNISIEEMEKVAKLGSIDYFGLGRPLIREPNLPNTWLTNIEKDDCDCTACNQCLDHLLAGEKMVRCFEV